MGRDAGRDALILLGVGLGVYLLLPNPVDAAKDAAKDALSRAGQALDDAGDWLLGPRPDPARVQAEEYARGVAQPSQASVDASMDAALARMGKTRADLESPDLLRAARELAADLARQGRPSS